MNNDNDKPTNPDADNQKASAVIYKFFQLQERLWQRTPNPDATVPGLVISSMAEEIVLLHELLWDCAERIRLVSNTLAVARPYLSHGTSGQSLYKVMTEHLEKNRKLEDTVRKALQE